MTTAIASARVPRLDDGRAVRFVYQSEDKFLPLGMAGRCAGVMNRRRAIGILVSLRDSSNSPGSET
jgi:hypothetical protein